MRLKTLVLCSSSAAIIAFAAASPARAQSDPVTPPDPNVEAQTNPADPDQGSPQTDDAADALAIAITHAHHRKARALGAASR